MVDEKSSDPFEALLTSIAGAIPASTANGLRDNPMVKATLDTAGIFGMNYMLSLLRRSVGGHKGDTQDVYDVPYTVGPCKREKVDIYCPRVSPLWDLLCPVIIFFHGGAWGSGHRRMYSLLGKRLREEGFVVVVAGYATYPCTDVELQIESVHQVIQWTGKNISKYGGDAEAIFLSGHSSGAHICAMHLLRGSPTQTEQNNDSDSNSTVELMGFIGLSGVYDIREHYVFEQGRNVHELSPMKPACR